MIVPVSGKKYDLFEIDCVFSYELFRMERDM